MENLEKTGQENAAQPEKGAPGSQPNELSSRVSSSSDFKQRLVRVVLGVVVGLAAFAGVMWLLIAKVGDSETLYKGKSAYYWSEQIKKPDPTVSNEAYQVLSEKILPHLTWALLQDTNDSPLKIWLIERFNNLPGVNIISITAPTRRGNAAVLLGEFGPAASASAPALLQAFKGKDEVVRSPAAAALGKVHADPDVVIPLLIKSLDDQDLAEGAAEGLSAYGSLAKAAVPKLVAMTKMRDKEIRRAGEKALSSIEPQSSAKGTAP
jgi:hypothetical protein